MVVIYAKHGVIPMKNSEEGCHSGVIFIPINDKDDRQIFCTYARYQRLGWILGWFLVGMGSEPQLNGYANEFNNQGCRLLLMEFNDSKPVPEWFWFIPRRGIIRFLFKG